MLRTLASPPPLFGERHWNLAAAAFAALLLVAFGPTLAELGGVWVNWPEYGHGLLMPPVAAWMIWERRSELARLRRCESRAGAWAAVLAACLFFPLLAMLVAGEMKLSWFLKPFAFVPALALGVFVLYGWKGLRALAAPLAVLMLMLPLPYRIHTALTLPLKHYAAVLATGLLDLTGLPAALEGSVIHLEGTKALGIVDACSGIRSLLSLISVAVLGCMLWRRHWSVKAVVIASCLPLAVLVNAVRIWLTGVLSVHVGPEVAQGFYHVFEGYLLFGVAAAALLGWALLLNYIVPRDARATRQRTVRETAEPASATGLPALRATAVGIALLALCGGIWAVYQVRSEFSSTPEAEAAIELEASLKGLPLELADGAYRGKSVRWADEIVAYSGVDAYGAYDYTDRSGRSFQVFLGGAVRNADNLHTPNVCMPASGWEALESGSVPSVSGGARMQRLLMQNGRQQMIVYYWFQSGARRAPDEWTVRVQRLFDVLKGRSLAPSLLVSVYVPISGDVEATESAARSFLREMGPFLTKAAVPGEFHG